MACWNRLVLLLTVFVVADEVFAKYNFVIAPKSESLTSLKQRRDTENDEIYDGPSQHSHLITRYRAPENPIAVKPSSNHRWDRSVLDAEPNGRGFVASVSAQNGETPGCGGTINATTTAQTLRSPDLNRDGKYEAALDCHWLIQANENQFLTLQFTSFDVQSCMDSYLTDFCVCNFVEIHDGPSMDSNLIRRFCGSEIPRAFISSTNHLSVRLVSDAEQNGHGFVASVSAQNR